MLLPVCVFFCSLQNKMNKFPIPLLIIGDVSQSLFRGRQKSLSQEKEFHLSAKKLFDAVGED